MRINAIQGTNSAVLVRRNKVQQHLKESSNVDSVEITSQQSVAFKGAGFKLGMGAAGAFLGGLIIGGPVGAIVGFAAGLQGANYAEADEEAKNNKDKTK